jgi:hypothetical protein
MCPDFCPDVRISIRDSVFPASIVRDSSYRGYVAPYSAPTLQVSNGGTVESRGVFRFSAFQEELQVGSSASQTGPVVATDSFRLNVTLARRTDEGQVLELAVFRLPADVDTAASFGDLDPFFQDSTAIGILAIADTVDDGQVSAILPGDAFPTLEADSFRVGIGFALRSAVGFADFVTINADPSSGSLTRYAQVDSADGELAARTDEVTLSMDNFVFPALAPLGAAQLTVGGAPAARAFLRSALPAYVVDSSNVLRATLIMVPSEPVSGAPGDTVFLIAKALATDVGPKSPVIEIDVDTLSLGTADVPVGSTDTVRIDITHIVRSWTQNPDRPRSLALVAQTEAASAAEFRFHSSESASAVPVLQVTYSPLIERGGG